MRMNGAQGALSSVVQGSLQKKDSLFFPIDVSSLPLITYLNGFLKAKFFKIRKHIYYLYCFVCSFKYLLFAYLFLAVLRLCYFVWAFSCCNKWELF